MIWLGLSALMSAVLLVAAFPPFNQEVLVWSALVPLLLTVHLRKTCNGTFAAGYFMGVLAYGGLFWWIGHVTPGGTAALCFYLALYPACWLWLLRRVLVRWSVQNPWLNLAAAATGASAWAVFEWWRGWFLTGFGWNGLGVALHHNAPMLQLAGIGGVLLLSWLIVFLNVMTARLLLQFYECQRDGLKWKRKLDLWVSLFGMVLLFSYGFGKAIHPLDGPLHKLRFAAVQANIPQETKFQAMSTAEIINKHTTLSRFALAAKPDLLLWPETATGSEMFNDADFTQIVLELARQSHQSFVFGAIEGQPGRLYNAAFHIGQDGARIEVYRKRHLVPFGEYAPLVDVLPFIRALVPFQVDYSPGEKAETFTLPASGVRLAPVICFEDTLSGLCRDAIRDGADILLNITNDAWFKSSPGASQHLANAIFRTVELDRPMLRSSNSGITCAIDQRGRVVDLLQIDGRVTEIDGVLSGELVWSTPRVTFYQRWGDWIVLLSAVVCAMVACFHLRKTA